jgi:glucan 1,3-beta-glucosidase
LTLIVDARYGKRAVIGTNLGGWMVLEPWITPSLFYQFLGKEYNASAPNIGMDSYTFCEALGPEKGNKWMKAHWETFLNE